jgi:molybdate transport system ATP-binding protein
VTAFVVDATVRRGGFTVTAAFEAAAGETVALLGPNGSGKSTLVAAIAGLERVERGRIALDERVLDEAATRTHVVPEDRGVGVVFQALLLFPNLSVLENVAFPLRARGSTRHEARSAAVSVLTRLRIDALADARPRTLSGGEAQRVALARALVAEPGLLLLDEPLSALDVSARAEVRDVLREELERFPGVRVLVTHDPVEATTLADRLVLLEAGAVTQIGTAEEVRDAPRSRYAADLVGVNAFGGRLVHAEAGSGRVVAEGGEVVVPWAGDLDGMDVVAIVRPADVTVSLEEPVGSARNAFRGPIRSIAVQGDRARVRIGTTPPIVAEVTDASVRRLKLRPGVEVWASFKAVEVEVVAR